MVVLFVLLLHVQAGSHSRRGSSKKHLKKQYEDMSDKAYKVICVGTLEGSTPCLQTYKTLLHCSKEFKV